MKWYEKDFGTYKRLGNWVANRSLIESYGGVGDYFGEYQCQYLEKGDMVRSDAVAISGLYWPIGKNGIAQKVGSLDGPPSIYILSASAYTLPRTLDNGEEIAVGNHSMIAAFEVR